jgi:transposase
MDGDSRRRMTWVNMFLETGNAGLTCRRCGISRPTLRKWVRVYGDRGIDGLQSKSSRPLNSPAQKINDETRATILRLRREKNIGARRIQIEMGLSQENWISRTIIQRTLDLAKVKPLKRPRRPAKPLRYNRPVPGDRVQMDTMKIKAGMYQYTAV